MERQYFSDISGELTLKKIDEIIEGKRQANEFMLLYAPTGIGKSTFAKNMLYDYCKQHNYKVLYLLPRATVKDEFIQELQADNKTDLITVMTYQAFEREDDYDSYEQYLANQERKNFANYDIIIADECHYFISDSIFNPYTYRSFSSIIFEASHALKFFITATPRPIEGVIRDTVKKSFNGVLWKYEWTAKTPEQQLMRVRFLRADYKEQKEKNVQKILDEADETEGETEKDIFNHVPQGEKAIVFCDSAAYAHNLYKKYKNDSMFICSLSNEKNKRYAKDVVKNSNPEAYNKMLYEHKFDCKYLFCTSALDVGFSIKDKKVKHIICLLWDWNGIVQAIGRKRIEEGESTPFTVYLKDYNSYQIGGLIANNKQKFEHYNYIIKHKAQAYYDKYEKIPDPAKIIYYGRNKDKQFTPCIDLFVLCYYADYLGEILNEINAIKSKKYKYQNWVLQQLGLPTKKERAAFGIEQDLKTLAEEKKIFVGNEGKGELAKKIGLFDDRGRLLTTPNKINPELKAMGVHYRIIKPTKRVDGKQAYFIEHITGQDE